MFLVLNLSKGESRAGAKNQPSLRAQRSNPEIPAAVKWQPFWIAAALRASQ
jgi:hypothetical protein